MEMRTLKNLCFSFFLVGSLAGPNWAQSAAPASDQAQPQANNSASPVVTVDQAIDRIIAREHDKEGATGRNTPEMETYIQNMKTDKEMGAIPVRDHYFLGQADLSKGSVDHNMLGARKGKWDAFNPISHMSGLFSSSYVPEGFLQIDR